MTDPASTLAAARRLVEHPAGGTSGLWPRAAALLARRALEDGLDEMWARRAPGLERASARAQLACLPDYLPERELAAEAAYAWSSLSRACHHHAYELGPTAGELQAHFGVVERVLGQLPAVPTQPHAASGADTGRGTTSQPSQRR